MPGFDRGTRELQQKINQLSPTLKESALEGTPKLLRADPSLYLVQFYKFRKGLSLEN